MSTGSRSSTNRLDDAARLLYQATKITAHAGPPAEARREVADARRRERRAREQAAEQTQSAVRQARIEEQLRIYGPPCPASRGQATLVGAGSKIHLWAIDGQFGALVPISGTYCGASGVAHAAPSAEATCKTCVRLSRIR